MDSKTVTISVDGRKVQITPGLTSFHEIVSATGVVPTTKSFSVSVPAPASTIGGNDSYNIVGGETLTSSH